jgi:hypothetical protein
MDLSNDPIAGVVQDLRSRGFIHTFTIQDSAIYCSELEKEMPAESLTIVEQHEVSGPEADAANTHKVYGVATQDANVKGIMLDTYAEYNAKENSEIMSRLRKSV